MYRSPVTNLLEVDDVRSPGLTGEGLSETASRVLRGATLEVVREIFKGFLVLRLLVLIPLLIVIVVLGVSALTGAWRFSASPSSLPFPPSWWPRSDG